MIRLTSAVLFFGATAGALTVFWEALPATISWILSIELLLILFLVYSSWNADEQAPHLKHR